MAYIFILWIIVSSSHKNLLQAIRFGVKILDFVEGQSTSKMIEKARQF
jgi:bifunctional ADP-heptose synthase (sugar kinase/adenylyltransferase)